MAEKTKMVRVEALQAHSYSGKDYKVGATYDIDEQLVDTLVVQGKAARADVAKAARAVAQSAKTQAAKAKPARKVARPQKTGKANKTAKRPR